MYNINQNFIFIFTKLLFENNNCTKKKYSIIFLEEVKYIVFWNVTYIEIIKRKLPLK